VGAAKAAARGDVASASENTKRMLDDEDLSIRTTDVSGDDMRREKAYEQFYGSAGDFDDDPMIAFNAGWSAALGDIDTES
jgi:hypothetical protein